MMMADSSVVQGEGRSNGGEQERPPPSVTARARSVWEALNPAAILRRNEARRRAEYEQARAAYEETRAAYANARGYDCALTYAHVRTYISLAVKASGLVALLLSTVILLGGYVQSLGKKDFFCIMAITVIQAAGIFQDWENYLPYIFDFVEIFFLVLDELNLMIESTSVKFIWIPLICLLLLWPLSFLIWFALVFYSYGPLACAAISSWRIAKLNHGNYKDDGTDSFADMVATLKIFYSLIIFQGIMFLLLRLAIAMFISKGIVASRIHSLEHLSEEWGKDVIRSYLSHIVKKCREDPLSIKGMDLIKYAAELLDSGSQEDYLYGARLLSAFIKNGKDIRWALLPSTNRIQKLIDSLWISSGSIDGNTEGRELAATIVADLAGHIDVARYSGAMRCISSLLLQEETTQGYGNSSKQVSDPRPEQLMKKLSRKDEVRLPELMLMKYEKRLWISQERRRRQKGQGGTRNKLVQLGLMILERLASNSDNRRLICSTPGLIPKMTAPLYSATLIKDEELENKAWADIVTRCLKVLLQLIRAPGWASKRLRHEIFSDNHALSNLMSILELGNEADHQELKLRAIEVLTELALDLSINLSKEIKEVLVTKQLKLFLLANGDDEESAAVAGRAMVSLSTNSESNSALIMTIQGDIIGRLTGIVNEESIITRRTIAAEILANLCAHCNVDKKKDKDILAKVLKKLMSIKTKSQERKKSVGQNNPVLGDEENQGNPVSPNNEERHNNSTRGNHTEAKETSDEQRKEQEAFLSLAEVICDKLDSGDLDGAIQSAVGQNNAGSEKQRREAFVDKLKTIVDDNHNHPTADSLRIVMFCGRIAKSVMNCDQYVEIFRNKGFKTSLSAVSKTMSELESCMLFVGTDFRSKKTVRPLFSEIEKNWPEM